MSFEENAGGAWLPVKIDGKVYREAVTATFTTGDAPNFIPDNNIAFTYPVKNQLNYYKSESNAGYIKLKRGQSYLFNPGEEWVQYGRFTPMYGSPSYFNFSYNSGARQVNFTTPANMQTNKIYTYELVNIPASAAGEIDRNIREVSENVVVNDETLDTEVTTREAEGSIKDLQEENIFTAYFRSSQYSTLAAKLNAMSQVSTYRPILVPWRIHIVQNRRRGPEYFDKAELQGTEFTGGQPLISPIADLSNNTYVNNLIKPLVYEGYPLGSNMRITWRDVNVLGLVPALGIEIYQSNRNAQLEEADVNNNFVPDYTSRASFDWYMAYYMANDFFEIQQKVVNNYVGGGANDARMQEIIRGIYPVITPGNYSVNLRYQLPGKSNFTSTKKLNINYQQ